jgi:hypothetical protein
MNIFTSFVIRPCLAGTRFVEERGRTFPQTIEPCTHGRGSQLTLIHFFAYPIKNAHVKPKKWTSVSPSISQLNLSDFGL